MDQQNLVPTQASEWKGKIEVEGTPLPLPSGNVALVRQMSPQAFITSGLIPDPLTAIIRKSIHTKSGLNPKDLEKIQDDPDMWVSALEMFDRILTYVAVAPVIKMPPTCDVEVNGEPCGEYANQPVHKNPAQRGNHQYREGPRDPSVLYADQVVMDDKVFIFQWCLGGTRDLERFREQLQASVESVPERSNGRGKAKRSA